MEIVINAAYGGYGLSWEAMKALAERKGFKLYIYAYDWHNTYRKVDSPKRGLDVFYSNKDLGSETDSVPPECYCSDNDFERNDPDLVAVVRELGDKANGLFAKLKIVKIPNDVDWEITEYDGYERVEEKHRSWG